MTPEESPRPHTVGSSQGSARLKFILLAGTVIGLLVQVCLSRLFQDRILSLRLPWCVAMIIALALASDALLSSIRSGLLWDRARLRSISGHVLALGLYVLCLLATYWPTLPKPLWPGKNFVAGDYQVSFYVSKSFALREIAQGRLPLWNPYLCLGVPAHAEMTQATFYLPSFSLMPFLKDGRLRYRAYFWFVIGHFVLASWGAYLLARSWRLSFLPSWLAGLCFGFGGFFAIHSGHPNMVFVAAWLPFLFMAYERMVFKDSFFWALTAGLGQGFVALGSYLHINVICSLFILGYVAFLLPSYVERRRGCRGVSLVRLASLCSVGFGLAILVAAVQLLPTQELSSISSATLEKNYSFSTQYGARPYHQMFLVLPQLFQDFASVDYGWWESYAYIGIIPILLIALSFSSILRIRRGTFLCLATLMAVFLSWSPRSLWHDILFAFAPVYGQFESAGRWCMVQSFCLSLAGAMALERITRRQKPLSTQDLGLTAGLLVFCILCSSRLHLKASHLDALVSISFFILATCAIVFVRGSRTFAQVVLVFLATTELLNMHNWNFPHGVIDEAIYAEEPRLKESRALIAGLERMNVRLPMAWDERWQMNSGSLYEIPSLDGYVNLPIAPFQRMSIAATQAGHEDLLDLLGVRYVAKEPTGKEGNPSQALDVLRREHPFPRAWMVCRARRADGPREAWKMIDDSQLNLRQEAVVILGKGIDVPLPWSEDIGTGTAEVVSYSPMEISIKATSDRPCLLVISDVFYPGWKAWCDGKPAEILRTDYCLRGILLSPGAHLVTMKYCPASFRLGALITTLSGIPSLLLLACWGWARTRTQGTQLKNVSCRT